VADNLTDAEMQFCKQAVINYNSFKNTVWHGDLYRLVDPYENEFTALMYVDSDKSKAIVFNYLVSNRQNAKVTERPVKLNGLDANKQYTVKEINISPGTTSPINSTKVYSGDFLMKVGINPDINMKRTSVVLEVNEVKN
ncbi:MAG: GH36 C-terminal domain-containing protein, partial [Bacteroidia bacterium]|nr:GH36 C-terminal domain-containing protein [Bacteroidia bacterium]